MKTSLGVVDDQQLFLESLVTLIDTFDDFEIVVQAANGKELIQKLAVSKLLPEIILVDVNMPMLGGPETVKQVSDNYPSIRTVALSMHDDDRSVLSMLRA